MKERPNERSRAVAVAACLMLLACLAAQGLGAPREKPTPTPKTSPPPTPSPPSVELQAVPGREGVERGEAVTVFLFVSNKSGVPLKNLSLSVPDETFEAVAPPALPGALPPFGSLREKVIIKPRDNAKFTTHKLLLTLGYAWEAGGKEMASAQPTTISLQVRRRFDEESKGFPGGTAAFLYLLLPVIPALLGYQFVDRLRKGEGVQLPTFKAEQIVPAFFAAILLSFLMLWWAEGDRGPDYSNPGTFVRVLAYSALAGMIIPSLRWAWNLWQSRAWGFKDGDEGDDAASYLRKALLSPRRPSEYRWATGTADGEQWQGILLEQPNSAKVLGAQLEVAPNTDDDARRAEILESLRPEVFDADGKLVNGKRLVELVEDNSLSVSVIERVKRGAEGQAGPVVVADVKNFKQTSAVRKPLVQLATS